MSPLLRPAPAGQSADQPNGHPADPPATEITVAPAPGSGATVPERVPASRSAVSSHVDETPAQFRRRVRRAVLVVALLSLVDSIIIKTTWNQVLLQAALVSWVLAVLTALGGAALMWTAGDLVASVQVHPNRTRALLAAAAVAGWALLGAGLFWLRWNAAGLAGASVTTEASVVDDSGVHTHQLMAVVMVALYLLPGILACIDGYRFGHPIEAHQRRSTARVFLLAPRVAAVEAEAVKVAQLLQLHADEIVLIASRASEAKRANASLAAELRAHARAEVLRRLGTPNAGGITHPDEQPPSTRQDGDRHDTRGRYSDDG